MNSFSFIIIISFYNSSINGITHFYERKKSLVIKNLGHTQILFLHKSHSIALQTKTSTHKKINGSLFGKDGMSGR